MPGFGINHKIYVKGNELPVLNSQEICKSFTSENQGIDNLHILTALCVCVLGIFVYVCIFVYMFLCAYACLCVCMYLS